MRLCNSSAKFKLFQRNVYNELRFLQLFGHVAEIGLLIRYDCYSGVRYNAIKGRAKREFLLGSFFIWLMHNPVDKAHNQILYIVAMFANQACSA